MSDIFDGADPILIAKKWLKDAEKTEINAPIRVVFGSNTSVFWADKI